MPFHSAQAERVIFKKTLRVICGERGKEIVIMITGTRGGQRSGDADPAALVTVGSCDSGSSSKADERDAGTIASIQVPQIYP
jgi:hypothetical protein